jgi:O-acetyl-ADP-ribose deacetylase (regulator of RNase III)
MTEQIASATMPGGQTVALYRGDLTDEHVDAIVNAANSALQLGGGVAGAILRKGGPSIQRECDRIGRTPVGSAAVTGAGDLPARAVIHAVGPRMGEGDEDQKLASAVRSALDLAEARGFASVAMPAISSGIFGFPKDRCARILIDEAERFCREHPDSALREIRFTLIDDETVGYFQREFARRAP